MSRYPAVVAVFVTTLVVSNLIAVKLVTVAGHRHVLPERLAQRRHLPDRLGEPAAAAVSLPCPRRVDSDDRRTIESDNLLILPRTRTITPD